MRTWCMRDHSAAGTALQGYCVSINNWADMCTEFMPCSSASPTYMPYGLSSAQAPVRHMQSIHTYSETHMH